MDVPSPIVRGGRAAAGFDVAAGRFDASTRGFDASKKQGGFRGDGSLRAIRSWHVGCNLPYVAGSPRFRANQARRSGPARKKI
jgi:hypothetical protein